MPRSILDTPSSLAYHIKRSVAHDEISATGRVVTMRRGNKIMTVKCPPHDDATATVGVIGADPAEWVTFAANETDTIGRGWDRV